MTRLRSALLAASALYIGFSAPALAADTYKFDPSHTQVVWSVNHFGFSHPSGKFALVDGSLTLDEAKPENSKVSATIAIANLYTGIDKLNEHILSDTFLDAKKFPTATFASNEVIVTGKDTAKVSGNLTLHGVTKPVTLDLTLNKLGENMMHKKTAGFSATTNIKRSDFGIMAYLPNLGDEVKIEIESEANIAQ